MKKKKIKTLDNCFSLCYNVFNELKEVIHYMFVSSYSTTLKREVSFLVVKKIPKRAKLFFGRSKCGRYYLWSCPRGYYYAELIKEY